MKYPNALEGIKKILVSQYMQIISVVCLLFGSIIILSGAIGSSVALTIVGSSVVLVASIVGILSLVFNLVGLGAAKKDENDFSMAFAFAVLAVIAMILSTVLGTIYPDMSGWLTFAARLFELGVIGFSVTGIISLAEQLGREDVARLGKTLRSIILVLWVIVLVVRIFGNQMERITTIMSIVSAVLELVSFILYIVLLAKARKMLEQS